jgi:hypothetical protein
VNSQIPNTAATTAPTATGGTNRLKSMAVSYQHRWPAGRPLPGVRVRWLRLLPGRRPDRRRRAGGAHTA